VIGGLVVVVVVVVAGVVTGLVGEGFNGACVGVG